MDELTIRGALPEDAEAIGALIEGLASFYLPDPDAPEDAASFFATITPEAIRERLTGDQFRYHVAVARDELAGVVGVRDDTHLYHLFVAEGYHRQGLASRLWTVAKQAAEKAGNPGRFTVNSSPYAVPVYERFGFVVTEPEVHKDGIVFVPMVLDER